VWTFDQRWRGIASRVRIPRATAAGHKTAFKRWVRPLVLASP
jgi:hypothetical protein